MKVVVLLAGDNKRFIERDYNTHKSLLKVYSHWYNETLTVLDHIFNEIIFLDSSKNLKITEVIFCVKNPDHIINTNNHDNVLKIIDKIKSSYNKFAKEDIATKIIYDSPLKAGALYSCYNILKQSNINNTEPIMIYNGDQVTKFDINIFSSIQQLIKDKDTKGLLIHCNKNEVKEKFHNLFGYSKTDKFQNIEKIEEKTSLNNTFLHTGHYFVKDYEAFLTFALEIFKSKEFLVVGDIIYNEYFISQIFQKMIDKGFKVLFDNSIENFISIGTPELYESHLIEYHKDS